ncbi:DUF4150 domain-containing protein [Myxococcus sp. AB056]|uniref:DUF4150 domain-containing protein n=1 Tax=Myxococcus sp. AB056 TaxID=2562792 RepID=UPI001146FFFE|nr:DUF4150 domain-containing protein [Myxococcus sp. AB056]
MTKVFANGRSILHKGAGNTHVSAAPDVCKVPTPAGPVPTPFVNSAQDSMLAKGSKKTTIEGNPVALTSSELSTSSGDEPGTAGGLISSKFKGKMTWGSGSMDVKVEGKGVVRFLDPTLHNGNTFNTSFISAGGTGLVYGDDPVDGNIRCPNCNEDKAEHRLPETHLSLTQARKLLRELLKVTREKKLSTLKADIDEDGSEVFRGYMIGVLICRLNHKIYAAMSGSYYLDGFGEAVNRLQTQDGRWSLCQPLAKGALITNPRGDEIPLSSFRQKKIGKNLPGVCAGPQLVQKALREGHIPSSMSELWFRPRILKRFKQPGVTVTVEHLRNGEYVKRDFRHRESVPSCDTCKVVLTEMLCDINKKSC